jgi:predicted amidohydrolase YtcJ
MTTGNRTRNERYKMKSSSGCDTVLLGGNLITVDDRCARAEAVAISQGKFIRVGTDEAVKELVGKETQVIDLQGKTVVPGFIDAHLHVLSSGIGHVLKVDCDLKSIPAVLDALRTRAANTKQGEWVQGFKYDDTKTSESRFLTLADLDTVSGDHPICVSHRAGHILFVNSMALEMAGISDDTPDPPGGKFDREPETGRLTGIVLERAASVFRPLLPEVTREDRREGLRRICRMFNAAGLTSVHDAIVSDIQLETYQEGLARGELTLRVYALMWHTHFHAIRDAGIRRGFGNDLLKIGGIKAIADGAIAGRTAWLKTPYEGSEDDCGIAVMSEEEVESLSEEVHRAGFQMCIHANGDAAIEMVLTAYEKAVQKYPRKDARHRIEHCTVVDDSILERMKKLECIATPFCTYVYYHGEKMKYYGEERLKRMFAQRSFIDHGIVSTGSTDYIPGPFEPLMGIQSCVTRRDSEGKVWGENQRISVEEALRLYTQNGAYASFEEAIKGSITPGKLADIVILGEDLTTVDPNTIKDIPVEKTMVGGKFVYEL